MKSYDNRNREDMYVLFRFRTGPTERWAIAGNSGVVGLKDGDVLYLT